MKNSLKDISATYVWYWSLVYHCRCFHPNLSCTPLSSFSVCLSLTQSHFYTWFSFFHAASSFVFRREISYKLCKSGSSAHTQPSPEQRKRSPWGELNEPWPLRTPRSQWSCGTILHLSHRLWHNLSLSPLSRLRRTQWCPEERRERRPPLHRSSRGSEPQPMGGTAKKWQMCLSKTHGDEWKACANVWLHV